MHNIHTTSTRANHILVIHTLFIHQHSLKMPYTKEIGHTPKYIKGVLFRDYGLRQAKLLSQSLDIPHRLMGPTIVFDDYYEAYVLNMERRTPWQRFIYNSIYS